MMKTTQSPFSKWPLIMCALMFCALCGFVIDSNITDASAATVPDTQTMIPHASWDCGRPQGIPAPANGTLVFEATMSVGKIYDLGQTQYGQRLLVEITGGSVSGPRITAQIMTGGLDYQLTLSNGTLEIEQILVFKTNDGKYINVRIPGTATSQSEVRIVPDFEAASSGSYAWLNTGQFAGIRQFNASAKTLKITVYDVANITLQPNAANVIRVTEPAGVPDQSYQCRAASSSETRGATLYQETVNIGSSQAVGSSKRGYRNIIPITGGTATGKIAGKVLAGGADFQILSSSMTIDARYTLQTSDGELIIVRNCGPASAPVPVFEARAAGKYGYLNNQLWLSSAPSTGVGNVSLTIYESSGGSTSSSSSGASSSGGCNTGSSSSTSSTSSGSTSSSSSSGCN
ncbi:MAG: DUF3237 domain-containing protein [Desulfobacteraceae bacterium]|nr:DUF3237 domain-containing protein [Desulfobacteraceae bacterium]